jgi:hypothetical protein
LLPRDLNCRFQIEESEWDKIPPDAPQSFKVLAQQCTSYEFSERPISLEVKGWLEDLHQSMEEDDCGVPEMHAAPAVPEKTVAVPPVLPVAVVEPDVDSVAADLSKRFDEVIVTATADSLSAGDNNGKKTALKADPPIMSPSLIRKKKAAVAAKSGRRDANLYGNLDASLSVQTSHTPDTDHKKAKGAATPTGKGRRKALMSEIEDLCATAGVSPSAGASSATSVQAAFSQKPPLHQPRDAAVDSSSAVPANRLSSGVDKLFPTNVGIDEAASLYKIFPGDALLSSLPTSIGQLEITRLAARNTNSLTPEMIKYLHQHSSLLNSNRGDPLGSYSGSIDFGDAYGGGGSSSSSAGGGPVPVKVGYLSKRNTYGFRNWKKFIFVVTKSTLAYRVSSDSASAASLSSAAAGGGVSVGGGLRYIQLHGASIERTTKDCRFRIVNASDHSDLSANIYNRELLAESVESMNEWIGCIQSAIDEANREANNSNLVALGLLKSAASSSGRSSVVAAPSSSSSSSMAADSSDPQVLPLGSESSDPWVSRANTTDLNDPSGGYNLSGGLHTINKLSASSLRQSISLINGCFNTNMVASSSTGAPVRNRTIADYESVGEWLSALNLSEYEEVFEKNGYKYDLVSAKMFTS